MTVATIQLRRDTAANWTSANPTLASGEWGYETDTKRRKLGDGTTAWASLRYDEVVVLRLDVGDETTAITTGTAKKTVRAPYAFTVTGVRGSLSTAQATGSIFTVDVNDSGTTILSTKLTIDNTEKTTTTAATPLVISDTTIADDAEITVDVDQVGDGTAKGLKVQIFGYRT